MSMVCLNALPCLQTLLPEGGIWDRFSTTVFLRTLVAHVCRALLLGGLLLFVFFGSSRVGSWLDIESVCWTCSVRDIVLVSTRIRGSSVGVGVLGQSFTSER